MITPEQIAARVTWVEELEKRDEQTSGALNRKVEFLVDTPEVRQAFATYVGEKNDEAKAGMCCLGVAEDLRDDVEWRIDDSDDYTPFDLGLSATPGEEAVVRVSTLGVPEPSCEDEHCCDHEDGELATGYPLIHTMRDIYGLPNIPRVKIVIDGEDTWWALDALNDGGWTFKQIAAVIRAQGLDTWTGECPGTIPDTSRYTRQQALEAFKSSQEKA